MSDFNFYKAWVEAAQPAYEALPGAIHHLVERVHVECAELVQQHDLTMPWPESTPEAAKAERTLREAFDAIIPAVLAQAAYVVYFYGHWGGGWTASDQSRQYTNSGTYWKFAHYADQALRGKLGFDEGCKRSYRPGIGWFVQEGMLHISLAVERRGDVDFTSERIGLATKEILEHAKQITHITFDTRAQMLREKLMPTEPLAFVRMLDTPAWMEKSREDTNAYHRAYQRKLDVQAGDAYADQLKQMWGV